MVRGAQAIATSAAMADWLFVTYITPLVPGDEDYAISFVMPMNAGACGSTRGGPFAPMATSVFDYPLSSRFDEVDATVVFDDVFVPWEHVFIYRNVDLVNAQFHDSPSHTTANFQALVRFGVKLEFMAGLAMRLAEVQTAAGDAGVQATLGGDIASLCAAFDALVSAAERFPLITGGVARPHPQYIYAGMGLQRRLIVDMMRTLRELAGGAFQTVPSSEAAFTSAETRADTERYYQSAAAGARERVKLLKLIWDFVGTEFGGPPAPVRDVLLGVAARRESAHVQVLRLERCHVPRRPLPQRILMFRPGVGGATGERKRSVGAAGVETTTRHAGAAPRRLGSIRARGARRHVTGTGPFDPDRTHRPLPLARRGYRTCVRRRTSGDIRAREHWGAGDWGTWRRRGRRRRRFSSRTDASRPSAAASQTAAARADVVVDCLGTTVVPGLIDSHCHVVLGDYTPRQKTVDFLDSYVHGGITSRRVGG